MISANAKGAIDIPNMRKMVAEQINRWLIQYGPEIVNSWNSQLIPGGNGIFNKKTLRQGDISALVLNITDSSLAFWEENTPPETVAPWVAADATGALVSAVSTAVVAYAFTGEVDWSDVAQDAVKGAIGASTGIMLPNSWFK